MATTLTNLVAYCNAHGWMDKTTAGQAQLALWIDNTIQLLGMSRRWHFYEREAWLNLTAPYSTGTVDLTEASTEVAAGDTTAVFATTVAGQEFYTAEDAGRVYRIASRTDAATIVLSSAYLGDDATGKTYEIRYVRYAAPTDWGQEGAFFFEDGRELNYAAMTLDEFLQARVRHRATSAYPQYIFHQSLEGTEYFFVHPAPSAAKQITYNYWQRPDTLTNGTDTTDWPDEYRGLLHAILRERMSTDNADAGLAVFHDRKTQGWIDAVFSSLGSHGPIPIHLPGDDTGLGGGKIPPGGLGAFFNVLASAGQ